MKEIKGVLFDIGGVLYNGEHLIDGAVEAVAQVAARFPVRFLTNTTRRPPAAILKKMQRMGFDVEESQLFTALRAARDLMLERGASVLPLMTDAAAAYFDDLVTGQPDYVVVGDAYTNFDYAHMNAAFRALEEGAGLIAAAKNRYFLDGDGKRSMDAGGFVTALEYASGKEAEIIGKPSPTFFHLAVSSMGLNPSEVLMVTTSSQTSKAHRKQDSKRHWSRQASSTPRILQKGSFPILYWRGSRYCHSSLLPHQLTYFNFERARRSEM